MNFACWKLEDEVHVNNEMEMNEAQHSENIELGEANDHAAAEVAQESLANETHDIEKQEIQESLRDMYEDV